MVVERAPQLLLWSISGLHNTQRFHPLPGLLMNAHKYRNRFELGMAVSSRDKLNDDIDVDGVVPWCTLKADSNGNSGRYISRS